jgi:putative aminopeptidase FrvX
MNRTQLLATLKRMSVPASAPYDELDLRAVVHTLLSEHGLHFQVDPYGNTVARVRRGMPRNKVAFVAHLDHPALRVVEVKGTTVTCVAEGDLPASTKGAKVVFPKSGAGGKAAAVKVAKDDAGHVEQVVVQLVGKQSPPQVNDYGVLDLPEFAAKGSRAKLRAADGLVGAAVIIGAMSQIMRADTPCEVWALFTRARHVGFQGAVALAVGNLVPRDLSIVAIEGISVDDSVELGSGPVVRVGDKAGPYDPRATALVVGAARALAEKKVPSQTTVTRDRVFETTAFSAFAYRAAGISIPVTCYHNEGARGVAPEEVDVRDLESAMRLVLAIAERAGAGVDDLDLFRNELVRSSEEGRQRLRTPQAGGGQFAPEF